MGTHGGHLGAVFLDQGMCWVIYSHFYHLEAEAPQFIFHFKVRVLRFEAQLMTTTTTTAERFFRESELTSVFNIAVH